MKRFITPLLLLLCFATVSAQTEKRATLGLALGGGSARGMAHVGVLEWLHEHRIPVDFVAGTSMGGLVGGAYATGLNPDELRALLRSVDWDLMFLGEPPYRQREFRRKEDRREFPMRIEAGLRDGFRLPSGLDPGHQVGLLLSYISFPYTSELSFDELPTPFRAVATTMDAAEVRVLDSGSLAQALLATMALPGIFPAVQIEGTPLADGGMLNNVPADVVRAMGADTVVAIDVTNRETDERIDALGQAARAIAVMMENATRRALLDADLVITPDLEGFGSLDWRRLDDLAQRGYDAAEAVCDELLRHAVSEAEWDGWRSGRTARKRDKTYEPSVLTVRGTTAALEELILERLDPHLGRPLDFEALGEDLTWVTGSEHFDRLRYEATGDEGLLIVAREKSHGPPFMRFGLDLSNEALDLAVGFKVRLIALDVGKPDAEVRADMAVGTTLGVGVEYYWPFAGTRMFLAPRAVEFRETRNVFNGNELTASVRDRVSAIGGDFGFTTSHSMEFRLGYQIGHVESSVAIGAIQPEVSGTESLARARFTFDRMDAPIIPERGFRVAIAADYLLDVPEAPEAFGLASSAVTVFQPLNEVSRVFAAFRGGSSLRHDAPLLYQLGLGGPFRLSSFDRGRFRGQHFLYGSGGYLRRVGRLPDFIGGPVYATGIFETGSAFDDAGSADWHGSISGGVIVETLLGPLLVAVALGDENSKKFYFILGDLFR